MKIVRTEHFVTPVVVHNGTFTLDVCEFELDWEIPFDEEWTVGGVMWYVGDDDALHIKLLDVHKRKVA